MDVNSILEHQSKEILKRMVDSTQGYSDRIKYVFMFLLIYGSCISNLFVRKIYFFG